MPFLMQENLKLSVLAGSFETCFAVGGGLNDPGTFRLNEISCKMCPSTKEHYTIQRSIVHLQSLITQVSHA